MKRSIEELTKNGWNQERAVRNIIDSFENDKVSCYVNKDGSLNFERYAIFGYRELIDYWLFSDWKGRGRCEHFDDFLKAVSYESLKKKAAVDLDSFLLLIEVVYNCYSESWGIPYQVYYMSCNLDHVLYNKQNSSNEEKEHDAIQFVKKYRNDLDGFIAYISKSCFSVQSNYIDSWNYIKQNLHSLERHTNLGLCFDETITINP